MKYIIYLFIKTPKYLISESNEKNLIVYNTYILNLKKILNDILKYYFKNQINFKHFNIEFCLVEKPAIANFQIFSKIKLGFWLKLAITISPNLLNKLLEYIKYFKYKKLIDKYYLYNN